MQQSGRVELDDAQLLSALESVLLVAPEPVSLATLASATGEPRGRVAQALEALQSRLGGGIRLQCHDGRYRLITAPENVEVVQRFLGAAKPPPLSRAALEALTVVAYRQPVTRSEIDEARGVDSDRALRTLLARGLIEERGRRNVIGRPAEFGTTAEFLEYFGLASLAELPEMSGSSSDPVDPEGLGLRRDQSAE